MALSVVAVAVGCADWPGAGGDDPEACHGTPSSCVDPRGTSHYYVVDSLRIPMTSPAALEVALDIDGDPQGRLNNQLGVILSTLNAASPFDIQAFVESLIADGTLTLIIELRATALDDARGVGGELLYGANPDPAPCAGEDDEICRRHLMGGALFDLDHEVEIDLLVPGRIAAGRFDGVPVAATLDIRLPEILTRPIVLQALGTRATSRVTPDGLTEGIVGGAVPVTEIVANMLPVLLEVTARDCQGTTPPCCDEDSLGARIMDLFRGRDGCSPLTLESLESDRLLQTVMEPDVDMLDAQGRYRPRSDGVNDSISFGIGFTAVPARIRGEVSP
jgi:hypothetical protein